MQEKRCAKCKDVKNIEAFGKNKRKKDGLQTYCRKCQKILKDRHYQDNKAYYFEKAKKADRKREKYFRELKDGKFCVDCGTKYPYYVLQYDHLDGKEFNISDAVYRRGLGKQKILNEIARCDIVCANCHAIRTHKRKNNTLVI